MFIFWQKTNFRGGPRVYVAGNPCGFPATISCGWESSWVLWRFLDHMMVPCGFPWVPRGHMYCHEGPHLYPGRGYGGSTLTTSYIYIYISPASQLGTSFEQVWGFTGPLWGLCQDSQTFRNGPIMTPFLYPNRGQNRALMVSTSPPLWGVIETLLGAL